MPSLIYAPCDMTPTMGSWIIQIHPSLDRPDVAVLFTELRLIHALIERKAVPHRGRFRCSFSRSVAVIFTH